MKRTIIFLSLLAAIALPACQRDIQGLDDQKAYIYFNMMKIRLYQGQTLYSNVDSLYYSFALDEPSVTTAEIKVPVNIIGVAADRDREYKVEVVADKTTASDDDWDKGSIATTVIRAGQLGDTLAVRVKRTEATKTQWKQIVLRVAASDDFQVGYRNMVEAKLSFTSILAPPDWWDDWKWVFGDFQREKFLKWQEIYHLGADPNVNKYGSGPGMGQPLYWDNMPSYPIESWFPSTFMFIRILKQYFIDHEVYPDGDTSKPRISLP